MSKSKVKLQIIDGEGNVTDEEEFSGFIGIGIGEPDREKEEFTNTYSFVKGGYFCVAEAILAKHEFDTNINGHIERMRNPLAGLMNGELDIESLMDMDIGHE